MVLSRQPSLQECLAFSKNDTVNPLTSRAIQRNKAVWKELTEVCRGHLPQPVQPVSTQLNVLSKPEGRISVPLNESWYTYLAYAYLTMKHQNDCGQLYSFRTYSETSSFIFYDYEGYSVLLYPPKLDKLIRSCESCPTTRFVVMPLIIYLSRG